MSDVKISMTLADLNVINLSRAVLGSVRGVDAGQADSRWTAARGALLALEHIGASQVRVRKNVTDQTVSDERHDNVSPGGVVTLAHAGARHVQVRVGSDSGSAVALAAAQPAARAVEDVGKAADSGADHVDDLAGQLDDAGDAAKQLGADAKPAAQGVVEVGQAALEHYGRRIAHSDGGNLPGCGSRGGNGPLGAGGVSWHLGWRGHWADALGLDAWALGRYQQALLLGRDWRAGFESALSVRGHVRDRAQQALQVRAHWRLAMQTAVMLRRLVRSAVQQGVPLRLDVSGDAAVALRLPGVVFVGVWQQAMLVPPRERQPRPGEQGPGPVTCYVPDADLVFCRKSDGSADLVFECRDCEGLGAGAIRVPVRRVYIVQNSISLTRTEGGVALHPLSFSLSLDADSWTWSWSATLPQAAGAHLGRQADGEPPVLEAVINGQAVHLRLESRALDERFLPTRWQVGGRGANAILAEPHAPVMGFAVPTPMAAQQLAQHVLTYNGVGIGWEVDWQIDDWHVPAGAWMHRGTHMSALAEMARAVGAYVQPEFTNRAIRILPRYPVAPWDWVGVTPQIELPSALAEMRSTDCIDRPVYDRVWVGGESAGVAGFVTRAGTLGEQVTEQVIHPLITDGTAQRMRGLAELANTGRQEHVTIGLQVLPQTGLILPGTWVRHTFPDGNGRQVLGIVRRLEVSYRMPKLRQYITLETHPYV